MAAVSGVEMAAVFLIFTSQAWNMALGVFEAIRTIPNDSIEALAGFRRAADGCGCGGSICPRCVPKLVYNSILSWVAGWYFLIACEIITVGPAHYRLPGLGSYPDGGGGSRPQPRSGRRDWSRC